MTLEVVDRPADHAHIRRKFALYLAWGVQNVWVADPETNSVTVDDEPKIGLTVDIPDEAYGGEALPGFRCKVAEFFE